MEEKYLKFYNKFIRHSKTVSDCGVIQNSELKRINYEKTFKSNKQFELNSKNMPYDFYIDSIILGHN